MRIRKTVSKLLGSAIVYPSLSDTCAPPQSPNLLEASDEICQLNQSPWDADTNPDLFLRTCEDLESSPSVEKEKQEVAPEVITQNKEGILVKSAEIKNKALRVCKSTREKKKKTTKEKEVILCNKNDGRKWFCKRPAQLPHSFCSYHASQSRSYYSATITKPKRQQKDKDKDKDKDKGATSSSSDLYYYYGGFGPWRGKKRGGKKEDDGKNEDEQDDDDDNNNGDEQDGGDNEEEIVSSLKGTGENKRGKKRGRKPLKCRSLKSLL